MTAFLGYVTGLKRCEFFIHPHDLIFYFSLPIVMSPKLSDIMEKHNIEPYAVFENLHLSNSRDQAS